MYLRILWTLAVGLSFTCSSQAQAPDRRNAPATPDIQRLVNEISAARLEADVRKLVSFGTRHTLSDTRSRKNGIGAARRWVMAEFERYGKAGGRRLRVELDTFTVQPDGRRILARAQLANVVATLPGTDPTDHRVLLVSGHLDSRVTDVMNATADAPGANDDASGVAVVLELARGCWPGSSFPPPSCLLPWWARNRACTARNT